MMDKILILLIIASFIILIVIASFIWLLWWGLRPIWLFKSYCNPYRRYCKKCGSSQEYMTRPGEIEGWWEEHREGKNPNCPCKQYQHYEPY